MKYDIYVRGPVNYMYDRARTDHGKSWKINQMVAAFLTHVRVFGLYIHMKQSWNYVKNGLVVDSPGKWT